MDGLDEYQLAHLEQEFGRAMVEQLRPELARKRASPRRVYRPQPLTSRRITRRIPPSYSYRRSPRPFIINLSGDKLMIRPRAYDRPYYLCLAHNGSERIQKSTPFSSRRRVRFSQRRSDITRPSPQSPLDWTLQNMYRVVRGNRLVRSPPALVAVPGLRNPNNLCYRNATIQFLMNLPPFTAWLAAWHGNERPEHRHCTLNGDKCVACFLGDLTRSYWSPQHRPDFLQAAAFMNTIIDRPIETHPIEYTVNAKRIPSFEDSLQAVGAGGIFFTHPMLRRPIYAQHDPAELINWLLDFISLNGRHRCYSSHHEIKELCQLKSYETRKCSSCGSGSTSKSHGAWITNLYLHHDSLSPTSVWEEIHKNLLDHYPSKCSTCSAPASDSDSDSATTLFTHRTHLTHLPEILTFAVLRSDHTGRKFPRPLALTEEIDLAAFTDFSSPKVRARTERGGGSRYRLQAMIQHAGDADFGHYIASARREDGEWYTMDDERPVRWVPSGVEELKCLPPGVIPGEPFYPAMLAYVRVPMGGEEWDGREGGGERSEGEGDGLERERERGQEDDEDLEVYLDAEDDYLEFFPRMPGAFYSDPCLYYADDDFSDTGPETPESESSSAWTASSFSATTSDNEGKSEGRSNAACDVHPRPVSHSTPSSNKSRGGGPTEREVKLDHRDELYSGRPASRSPSVSPSSSLSPASSSPVSYYTVASSSSTNPVTPLENPDPRPDPHPSPIYISSTSPSPPYSPPPSHPASLGIPSSQPDPPLEAHHVFPFMAGRYGDDVVMEGDGRGGSESGEFVDLRSETDEGDWEGLMEWDGGEGGEGSGTEGSESMDLDEDSDEDGSEEGSEG